MPQPAGAQYIKVERGRKVEGLKLQLGAPAAGLAILGRVTMRRERRSRGRRSWRGGSKRMAW